VPKPVAADTLDDAPAERRFRLRGKPYHFVEISVAEYDRIEKLCLQVQEDGEDRINGPLRSNMLLQATCVEPKMTMERISGLPFALGNSLMSVINKMYYEIEKPVDMTESELEDEETKGEG
jgi:hypothetical protein